MLLESFDGRQDISHHAFDGFQAFRTSAINRTEDAIRVEEAHDLFKVLVCECIDKLCGRRKQVSSHRFSS